MLRMNFSNSCLTYRSIFIASDATPIFNYLMSGHVPRNAGNCLLLCLRRQLMTEILENMNRFLFM